MRPVIWPVRRRLGKPHTVVATLGLSDLPAAGVFNGPIDKASFLAYVEQVLVPTLRTATLSFHRQSGRHKHPSVHAAIRSSFARERCRRGVF